MEGSCEWCSRLVYSFSSHRYARTDTKPQNFIKLFIDEFVLPLIPQVQAGSELCWVTTFSKFISTSIAYKRQHSQMKNLCMSRSHSNLKCLSQQTRDQIPPGYWLFCSLLILLTWPCQKQIWSLGSVWRKGNYNHSLKITITMMYFTRGM